MLLKLNSRGPEVKLLQEFLNIGNDGIFGKGTEAAVKSWQSDNRLTVDGIVGPITWKAMGLDELSTTDNSEKLFYYLMV
jgi:peptidoglycan hydrolase-like protein with peptidoglycan-binding domain